MRPDVSTICTTLCDLQRDRKYVIATQVAMTNRACAHITSALGLNHEASESERDAAWSRARRIVEATAVLKFKKDRKTKQETVDVSPGKQLEDDFEIVDLKRASLTMFAMAVAPVLQRQGEIELEMKRLALQLPVAQQFIADTPGFDALGLAVIVGEAGDLSNYPTVRRLWRRLGLGMHPGHEEHAYSTWRKLKTLSADDWTLAGYSPKRLGQIVGVVTIPLVMQKAKNKYGPIWEARRQRTMETHPEWYCDKNGKPKVNPKTGAPASKHGQVDANRIVTKALLADLWGAWRRSKARMNANTDMAVSTRKKAA